MAMAILPEEFPVVLTIFLALGAWRISHKHVLTRRVPTVETLGAATVLCVDKTGTLTQNRMSVGKLLVNGDFWTVNENSEQPLPEKFHELFEVSILASRPDPFDPMEKALKELGRRYLRETEHLHDDWRLMREYPLSQELLSFAQVWQSADQLRLSGRGQRSPRGHRRLVPFQRDGNPPAQSADSLPGKSGVTGAGCGPSFLQFLNFS